MIQIRAKSYCISNKKSLYYLKILQTFNSGFISVYFLLTISKGTRTETPFFIRLVRLG